MKTSATRTPLDHQEKEKKVAMSAIRNMKASGSCCFRLVNQSTCGHVRRTQRGKWHPESSRCVLSTAALLGKTRERQPAHSEVTPQIAGLESCALRLRSVDSERGHSPRYPGKPRSRSRVDSAMALLIWNGQSEKRQRAPNVGVIGAVDVESTKRALAGTIKPAGKKRTKTTGYNRLSQRLTRPVQSSLVTDYHC